MRLVCRNTRSVITVLRRRFLYRCRSLYTYILCMGTGVLNCIVSQIKSVILKTEHHFVLTKTVVIAYCVSVDMVQWK